MTVGIRTTNADGTRARGGSNGNERGGSKARAARRAWLVMTYRADVDLPLHYWAGEIRFEPVPLGHGVPACRCYRCGALLSADNVSADRIIPGCKGGTYRHNNIRPACSRCNSITGATTRRTDK